MKRQTVTIIGKFESLNEYIKACRSDWAAGAKMIRNAENKIIAQLRRQRITPFNRPVRIEYHYYETTKRRDKDNVSGFFHKVFQDALVKAKIIPDDGWKYIDGFSDEFGTDKHAHIEITITEVRK